jgi:diketogulonate reductase-like aldo/keto reductase
VPIPGTTKLQHLNENLGVVAVEFTPDELREIKAAASNITVQGARLPEPSLRLARREAPLPRNHE